MIILNVSDRRVPGYIIGNIPLKGAANTPILFSVDIIFSGYLTLDKTTVIHVIAGKFGQPESVGHRRVNAASDINSVIASTTSLDKATELFSRIFQDYADSAPCSIATEQSTLWPAYHFNPVNVK